MVTVVKKKLINYCMNLIKEKFPNYDNDKMEIIEYGLVGLYLTFTKIIIITFLAIILGKLNNVILLLVLFNIIRFSSFGLHAEKSFHCLIISIILFIGGMFVCEYAYFPLVIKAVISISCIILISRYAPADTERRPLINKKKRKKYKIISIISSMIFSILIIYFNELYISNYLFVSLIEATIMILPISYKILNLSYDNYKKYNLTEV